MFCTGVEASGLSRVKKARPVRGRLRKSKLVDSGHKTGYS